MSKTLKDSKGEKEKKGGKGLKRRDQKRPPLREKGGMRSLRELVEEEEDVG